MSAAACGASFRVPGEQEAFLEVQPVPHGEVRIVYYRAGSLGKIRRMHIYLPPGYDTSKARYPVLYLIHGAGEDDSGWVTVGMANIILDNLIAQGKAKPMIVVMPTYQGLASGRLGRKGRRELPCLRQELRPGHSSVRGEELPGDREAGSARLRRIIAA